MIYYSVFDSQGNKIADCGNERDAKFLANCRFGTYKTNRLHWKETVDIEQISKPTLPSILIGGKEIPIQQNLPESSTEIFIPDFHD